MVCTPRTAYDLHKAWPESTLVWIPDAGHSAEVIQIASLVDTALMHVPTISGARHQENTN